MKNFPEEKIFQLRSELSSSLAGKEEGQLHGEEAGKGRQRTVCHLASGISKIHNIRNPGIARIKKEKDLKGSVLSFLHGERDKHMMYFH